MNPITIQNSSFKRMTSHFERVVLPMETMSCSLHNILNFEASVADAQLTRLVGLIAYFLEICHALHNASMLLLYIMSFHSI
jgi:hypothetical protein